MGRQVVDTESEEEEEKFEVEWVGEGRRDPHGKKHYEAMVRLTDGEKVRKKFCVGDVIHTETEGYTAHIVDMYETKDGMKYVMLRWLYLFRDMDGKTKTKLWSSTRKEDVVLSGELFWSDHLDENPIGALSGEGKKLTLSQSVRKYGKEGVVLVRRFYRLGEEPALRWLRPSELELLVENPTPAPLFKVVIRDKSSIPNQTKSFLKTGRRATTDMDRRAPKEGAKGKGSRSRRASLTVPSPKSKSKTLPKSEKGSQQGRQLKTIDTQPHTRRTRSTPSYQGETSPSGDNEDMVDRPPLPTLSKGHEPSGVSPPVRSTRNRRVTAHSPQKHRISAGAEFLRRSPRGGGAGITKPGLSRQALADIESVLRIVLKSISREERKEFIKVLPSLASEVEKRLGLATESTDGY